jgi:hypothetical protein
LEIMEINKQKNLIIKLLNVLNYYQNWRIIKKILVFGLVVVYLLY